MKSLLFPDGGDETFHPEQLFWAGPTSRRVDVRLVKLMEAENKTGRSSTTEAMNVSWLCQRHSDVFTAFALLFRRAKRDKLSWNINTRSSLLI